MKKNSEYVKILLKDLQRKTEIDQKVDYYKNVMKAEATWNKNAAKTSLP